MPRARRQLAERRVLQATVAALKDLKRLRSDQPGNRHTWLQPAWPAAFVIDTHRDRLVQLLVGDAEIRTAVRAKLSLPIADEALDCSSPDQLEQALRRTPDPQGLFEAAATHSDGVVARSAVPFLLGAREIPEPDAAHASGEPPAPSLPKKQKATRGSTSADSPKESESLRRMRRSLEKAARTAEEDAKRLRTQLAQAREELSETQNEIARVRSELPSRKERRALANASQLQAELERTKRALKRATNDRDTEFHSLRGELAQLRDELSRTSAELEAEQRGRRRLTDEQVDSTERARRLLQLVKREILGLEKRCEAERVGPGRTRLKKALDNQRRLADLLREIYGLDETAEVRSITSTTTAEPTRADVDVLAERRGIRVTPLGGNDHIGGSAVLIEAGSMRLLVDAGLRPNAHLSRPGPKGIDAVTSGELDAVIVTHAHADHAGFVPWVVERQRRAKVICTPETAALLPTVWADSVQVMRAEADAMRGPGDDHAEPPYGDAEVMQAEERLEKLAYGRTLKIRDVEITLFPAGHVLGAAGVVIRSGGRCVVVTGDIDDRAQESVGPAKIPPKLAKDADLLVVETTYCDSRHKDRSSESSHLVIAAQDIVAAGGRVLIPAFGLGRAQEIALLLGKGLPDVPVRIDGLARNISEIYERNGAPEIFTGHVARVENRFREILGFHNGIVITTSGMLTGGAAVPWARAILQEPESGLFLCGHQDEEAPGRQLERLLDADPDSPREIHLRDPNTQQLLTIPVQAKVDRYNLSAHADLDGLLNIIDEANPKAIMLVHGEPGPQRRFRAQLEAAKRVVVDNRETWDSESPTTDTRSTRWRHPSRYSGRAGLH